LRKGFNPWSWNRVRALIRDGGVGCDNDHDDYIRVNIVTRRLKTGILEPEEMFIATQRLCKQVPTATNTQETIEVLLEVVFPILSVQSVCKRRELRFGMLIWPRVLRNSDPKMTALAMTSSNCKRQTRPLVREGAPNQQTRNCQTINKIWS
jgi:hypothetical protein